MIDFKRLEDELYERVLNYAKSGASRKRLCCEKHSFACLRFLDDLKSDKYYFDKNELMRFYLWSKQFKHRAGVLAGRSFELNDFLLWLASNILCIKNRINDLRKYKTVYVQVGRKNGKSQFMACLVTYFAFVKGNQEIYLSGWNKDGSDIVYKEIKFLLKSSDFLVDKYKTSYGQITVLKNDSFIKPLSKEAKNNDNANNPSLAIVDEYKDHLTDEIWQNLKTGMVARPDGLLVTITTAGYNVNCPCKELYDHVSKILNPEIDVKNDSFFADIHELEVGDDFCNSDCWIKANPTVMTYDEGKASLKEMYEIALASDGAMRKFLTKNMNMWVDMADDGYMDMKFWNECAFDFDVRRVFSFGDVFCGVDLSMKWDLSSVVFGTKFEDKYYFIQQSFMPEYRFNQLLAKGEDNWFNWKSRGFLTVTSGNTINIDDIISYIENFKKSIGCNIVEIDYDSWNANQFAIEMEKRGFLTVEIRQGFRTLSEGTSRFREEVYNGNVVHLNDGLYGFCMSNAIVRSDLNRNIVIDKKKSKNKIDPVDATINVCSRIFSVEPSVDYSKVMDTFFDLFGDS